MTLFRCVNISYLYKRLMEIHCLYIATSTSFDRENQDLAKCVIHKVRHASVQMAGLQIVTQRGAGKTTFRNPFP